MPRVRIKQLEERVATSGLFMGESPQGNGLRRKLEPGEVVDIPDGDLLDALWETDKLELTRDPTTRPLDYGSVKEAQLCSPTYRPRGGQDEEDEMQEARAAVAARLGVTPASSNRTKSPAGSRPASASGSASAPAAAKRAGADLLNRRAARRAAVEGGIHDAEVPS